MKNFILNYWAFKTFGGLFYYCHGTNTWYHSNEKTNTVLCKKCEIIVDSKTT